MKEKILTWIKNHKPHTIAVTILILLLILLFLFFAVSGMFRSVEKSPSPTVSKNTVEHSEASSKLAASEQELEVSDKQQTSSSNSSDNSVVSSQKENTNASEDPSPDNNSGNASASSNGSNSSGSSPSQPVHQHDWKAHEVWVSDIITVEDSPAQTIYGAQLYTQQPDGTWISNGEIYWFENGFTMEDFKAILKDKIKNEGYIGNYVNRTKTIPAVTHTEDHGSYQIDYYYCDCGAKKYS